MATLKELTVLGNTNLVGDVKASSFKVNEGTSDQFLKADGSVDDYTRIQMLLEVAPTIVVRGRVIYVSHPLIDYDGAEIVLMRYSKKNGKKRTGETYGRNKKGFCVAVGGDGTAPYFTFTSATTYSSIIDFLDEMEGTTDKQGVYHKPNLSRHFGIALRIPNPAWNRNSTIHKNGIYKGVHESLWSVVLPIRIGKNPVLTHQGFGIGLY